MNAGFPDIVEASRRILQSGNSVIVLIHGMFSDNIMTNNPGNAKEIQKQLTSKGTDLIKEANEINEGPIVLCLQEPDENQLLIDQH